MPVARPYRRTFRAFVDGEYTEGGRGRYVTHPGYAEAPSHYVRAFLLLLSDVRSLFEFVEPADANLGCYSHRIHNLLFRGCVEVEANCRAILAENGYPKNGDNLKMPDYRKIERTHRLSSYEVRYPHWTGSEGVRRPFAAWAQGKPLPWWNAYNQSKHDRHAGFPKATFACAVDACAAALVLLSSQFGTEDFSPTDPVLALSLGPGDGTESGIGGYLRVRFPNDWPLQDRYDFDWSAIAGDPQPFDKIDYTKL